MGSFDRVALSHVMDVVNLVEVTVNPCLPILKKRAVVPRVLPELVSDGHILLGPLVSLIVRRESLAKVVCSIGQRIRDDIPGNAPPRRVIKGRNLASEIEGVFLHNVTRKGQPKMLRVVRQRGHDDRRMVTRDLQAHFDVFPIGVLEVIIQAHDICKKITSKSPVFSSFTKSAHSLSELNSV